MEVTLEKKDKDRYFEELVTRDGFKIYEANLLIDEVLELMEQVHKERTIDLDGHEIRLRESKSPEPWSIKAQRDSSNEDRYNSLDRNGRPGGTRSTACSRGSATKGRPSNSRRTQARSGSMRRTHPC
jgi:hypothetical protein